MNFWLLKIFLEKKEVTQFVQFGKKIDDVDIPPPPIEIKSQSTFNNEKETVNCQQLSLSECNGLKGKQGKCVVKRDACFTEGSDEYKDLAYFSYFGRDGKKAKSYIKEYKKIQNKQ